MADTKIMAAGYTKNWVSLELHSMARVLNMYFTYSVTFAAVELHLFKYLYAKST